MPSGIFSNFCRSAAGCLATFWLGCAMLMAAGAFATEPIGSDDPSTATAPAAPASKISLEEVAELRKSAESAEQISAADLPLVLELYDKAAGKLTEATRLSDTAESLRQELADAAQQLDQAQAEAAASDAPKAEPEPLAVEDARASMADADSELKKSRELLQQIASEIDHRKIRRQSIPETMATDRQQLAEIEQSLKTVAASESPDLAKARQVLLLARREFRQRELDALDQEIKTYDGTTRVWLLRRDNAERKLKVAQRHRDATQALVAAVDRREADEQVRQASRAAANAHPAVKGAAAINSELAEKNKQLVSKTESIRHELEKTRSLADLTHDQLSDLTKRTLAAKSSPAMGMLLRSRRDQLPALGTYRRNIRARSAELSELGFSIYEWESQRQALLDVDDAVSSAIQNLDEDAAAFDCDETASALHDIFISRSQLLAELISNATIYVTRLEELEAAEQELILATHELDRFISEQVLWVRSAPALSWRDLDAIGQTVREHREWQSSAYEVTTSLAGDVRRNPLWYLGAAAIVGWLVAARGRFRSALQACGREASRPTTTTFRPTLLTVVWTALMAAPVPVLLAFLGWRITAAAGDNNLGYAVGWSLIVTGAAYAMLNLIRHTCRPLGLGALHFGWDDRTLAAIRHSARTLEIGALPPLAVAVALEFSGNEPLINSAGRVALIFALGMIGYVSLRLCGPSGALANAIATAPANSFGARLGRMLIPASSLSVLALIVASAIGYHYTSMQLTRRLLVSAMIVFGGLTLRELLLRWLLVSYRRMAIQRSRERRQALAEAQESAAAGDVLVDPTPEVRLTDINRQARALVSTGAAAAFICGMWLLWSDVLPALGILNRVPLWESASAVVATGVGPTYITITLADLLMAIVAVVLTWYAGRNVPSLLEIAVLQRLPIDAGARYAASSVTRYVLVVAGIVLSLRLIGIGWSSVQWLVAAMTVGLGFGLQEIFANFVSGIILLFERPARVGDTVTIGTITGTITRIRIRATTVLDWDNKELIVPNKEFVTGNLVNWTLTNPILRLIIQVGVAYGSDTRLTTELLYRVARENPEVLEEPAPIVVFSAFGDSSLNFELRLFVSDLSTYRRLRHDLHIAIDDEFRKHGIEIAFPQCDMHLRSLPDGIYANATVNTSREPAPSDSSDSRAA
jgi:small-conductance mechanosensitive channel